jgi:hypothetical protein
VGTSGMYIATVILFVIPWSILWLAWRSFLKNEMESVHRDWRSYIQRAALYAATLGTFATMLFFFSWTHSGGSPHGGQPPSGLWLFLRPIAVWSVVATVVIGVFGKGRSRLLVLGSALSIFCVSYLLAALEMD